MNGMEQEARQPVGLGGARSLFLALYLVLLAFFIALISLSTFEDQRTRAVVDSLWATFAGPRATLPETGFPSRSGRVVAPARQMMAEVGPLFQTDIPAAQITERAAGEVLEVMLSAKALFEDDGPGLRPGRERLVDGIAAALAAAPGGLTRVMEALVTTGDASSAPLPEAGDLSLRRAAELGRVFLARGAPPNTLRVGVAPGPLSQVILTFRIAPPEAPATPDDEAGAPSAPEPRP